MSRILFITATRIGDAVLASGLVDHLARTELDARITVACGPLAAPLFRAAPCVEDVIVMEKRPGGGHWLDLWRRTVSRHWDLVVDLRGSATSWFLRAGRRVVKRRGLNGAAVNGSPVHKVVEASRVLDPNAIFAPALWLDAAAEAEAARLIPDDAPVLALAPAAAAPFKEWAPERFSELAGRLTGPGGALEGGYVVLLGGPGDEATAAAACKGLREDRVIDLVGKLGLLEAGACLRRATLFVGNDSGLMHIAAAAGTPTLGLFGPTDERVYGPWGDFARPVRAGGPADERERGRLRFAEESLMGALEVDPVVSAAEQLLSERKAA
ncbi:glycosyltransferase family 9 protein [Marinicauda salina]|uniref:Glycosyltransferase family 9 protein n=1 Tax=Marinicauda salina TaxID=2135793 RepID=A0A2U2BUC5_9PROT|nr:glycosyltransferase family 9 protein [Marinicauda salina]PWE17608.1 glycosyltransferase family 9 protein [Marinicauda salina]